LTLLVLMKPIYTVPWNCARSARYFPRDTWPQAGIATSLRARLLASQAAMVNSRSAAGRSRSPRRNWRAWRW